MTKKTFNVPKVFSLIEDPDSALEFLAQIPTYSLKCSAQYLREIYFDHRFCREMDLASSAILDKLVLAIYRFFTINQHHIILSGQYPKNENVRKMFQSAGLIKTLRIPGAQLPDQEEGKYILFPIRTGGREKTYAQKSSDHEQVSSDLSKYFDDCLKTQGFQLTTTGHRNLKKLVAEVLGNSEEHSSIGSWHILAFLSQHKSIGECNLAIFNFGESIYETLTSARTQPLIQEKMRQLSNHHVGKSYFGPTWTEEVLWTLYSLQEGVSRHTGSTIEVDRGNGTIEMIKFFFDLGGGTSAPQKPKMTLISGSACISFDGTYNLAPTNIGDEVRNVIAFNSQNDLNLPPDSKYVRKLKNFFPGTLLSMKFFLDKSHYKMLPNGGGDKRSLQEGDGY